MAQIRVYQAALPTYRLLLAVLLAKRALLLANLRTLYRCPRNRVLELVLEGLGSSVVRGEAVLQLPILPGERLKRFP